MREVIKIKSGLSVVLAPMPTESVTILALIKAGSRDEVKGQFGAAHFLEHFVFKGTRKYPKPNDISRTIDSIGGLQNAFTWNDYTGYWVKVASDKWETGLSVVGQLVSEPLLPQKELEKEKGAIIEEIKMYEDNYPIKAFREMEEGLFMGSSLERPILGTVESIKAMKTTDLKAFRASWYLPENMVVLVVGGIEKPQKVLAQIEQEFSPLESKKTIADRIDYHHVFTQEKPITKIITKKTEQAHLAFGVKTFAGADKRQYTLEVLANILGGNMSSRLWDEIREKRGLAYYIKCVTEAHSDTGLLAVRAGVRVDKVQQVVDLILEQLKTLTEKQVSQKELERGKASLLGRLKLELEDSQEVAMLLADDFVMREAKIRKLDEILDAVNRVSAAQIKDLASELFVKKNYVLSVVGPMEDTNLRL